MATPPVSLAPCPFCGSTDLAYGEWQVECSQCRAKGPEYDSGPRETLKSRTAAAVAAWNRRVAQDCAQT